MKKLLIILTTLFLSFSVLAEWNFDWQWWDKATLADVEAKLQQGNSVHARSPNKYRWTVLGKAAGNGTPEIIRLLIANGAKVNETDDNGDNTALHRAAQFAKTPANIKALIAAGADVNAKDGGDATPLHSSTLNTKANSRNIIEIIKTLIAAGTVNTKDTDGKRWRYYFKTNKNIDKAEAKRFFRELKISGAQKRTKNGPTEKETIDLLESISCRERSETDIPGVISSGSYMKIKSGKLYILEPVILRGGDYTAMLSSVYLDDLLTAFVKDEYRVIMFCRNKCFYGNQSAPTESRQEINTLINRFKSNRLFELDSTVGKLINRSDQRMQLCNKRSAEKASKALNHLIDFQTVKEGLF